MSACFQNNLICAFGVLKSPVLSYNMQGFVEYANLASLELFPAAVQGAALSSAFDESFVHSLPRQAGLPLTLQLRTGCLEFEAHVCADGQTGLMVFTQKMPASGASILSGIPSASLIAASMRDALSACFLALGILTRETALNPPDSMHLAALRRGLFRMLRLSRGLDFMALALSDAYALNPSLINVSAQLQMLVQNLQPHFERRGVRLRLDNRVGEVFNATLDVDKCELLLMHLLSNAVKYTLPGGTVTVLLAVQEGDISFGVEDTGRGIPHAQMLGIRRRFAFPPNYTDPAAGLGLGLSIAHEVVALHRGSIDIESTEGEGTKVHILLPYEPQIEPVHTEETLRSRVLYNDGFPSYLIELSDILDGEAYV